MGGIVGAILAAGQGKRMMDTSRPKVLARLRDKPLLWYVLQSLQSLTLDRCIAIVGYQREQVIAYLAEHFPYVEHAVQAEQLGTGHAVLQLATILKDWDGTLLIVNGDVPLVKSQTYATLLEQHRKQNAAMTILTTIVPNPAGYGRIIRDEFGSFHAIIEDADLPPSQRHIAEINTGIYVAEVPLLFDILTTVTNSNSQGEFYLTDAANALRERGKSVYAWCHPEWEQFLGVNTAEQLAELSRMIATANVSLPSGHQ